MPWARWIGGVPFRAQCAPALRARGIFHDARGAIPERLVDALDPQIARLVDVRIGGDQLQLSHGPPRFLWMGDLTWPPNPQRSSRPGGAVALLIYPLPSRPRMAR